MISLRKLLALTILACLTSLLSAQAPPQEGRLLLFPDIHKDKIAFVYGGDIWLASSQGGEARRITTDPGL